MRKKRWAAALAAALCVLMLAGCKGKPLPDGMEEDAVLAAGEAVVQQLTDGDYSAVLAQFRSDIREGLTAEQIQTQVETATEKAGQYRKLDDTLVTGSQEPEPHGIAVIYCKYTKDSVMWELCEGDRFKVQGRTAFQGARLGDPAAKRVLNTYLHGLSIGIINLINILQPEIICLGGGISNAEDDLLLDPLRQLVDEGTFDKSNPTRLEKASLGNDAGVVGAALLCHMM